MSIGSPEYPPTSKGIFVDIPASQMADVQVDGGGLKRTLKDLFAGAAGGVAQVLLGQCFGVQLDLNCNIWLKKISTVIQKTYSDLVVMSCVCLPA